MQLDFAELFNIQGDDCFKEFRKQIVHEEKPNETSPLMRPMRAVTSSGSISDMGLSSLPPSIATSFASLGELCMDSKLSEPEESCWEVCDAFLKSRHSALETPENISTFGEMDATPRPTRPVSDFRKYKTELCRNWEKDGECQFGEGCIFAHGEGELRSETNNETLKLANQLLGSQELEPCRRTRRRRRKNGRRSEGEAEDDDSLSVSFEEPPKTPSPTQKNDLLRPETPTTHHVKKNHERNINNTSPVLASYNHVQQYTPGLSPMSYPMHSHFPHFHQSHYPSLHNLHYVPSVPNFARTMSTSNSFNVGIGEGNRQMRWT